MYKLILFDFDGTIADTSDGILDSHRYALRAMNHEIPPEKELKKLIGGNLLKIYSENFGFNEVNARDAIKIYRKRYADIGIHKAIIYPKFKELLLILKKKGVYTGVATLKAEKFAKQMLSEMEIEKYFDIVCGMDQKDSYDKAMLISRCIEKCGCDNSETLFVGDTMNDCIGAQTACVDFIGVSYGFGFKRDDNIKSYNSLGIINNPIDLISFINSTN